MFKMSLHAIIRVLTSNQEIFSIVQASPELFGEGVIRFEKPAGYLPHGQHYYNKDTHIEASIDKNRPKNFDVGLHYDLNSQQILSICERWYDIIKAVSNVRESK